ncbi:PilZ domain-containing protein [Croceicoccus bisphenolivorans]|uniref:PilZ domain-containing protein n=1 Tax=Croceicoccus bisphenolivorans TaxID=1783232 RepID=UPI000A9F9977|nr:PilZ domain-containing protein [Croceicoccus bisphenolivorans]
MNDLSLSNTAFPPATAIGRYPERMPIIRTAKLIFPEGEYPCVLRDISGNALRVKIYGAPLPDDGRTFWLEFGDGDRFEVSLIWSRDGQAGLAFTEHNDLMSLIGEKGPFRKRAIRIAVDLPATVRSLGRSIDVRIRDLSHEGAQIECPDMFSMDQQVQLAVPALGEVYAKVRWRQHPGYGLAFLETFRFEEIANVAANLQALSKVWRDTNPMSDGGTNDGSGIAA